MVHVEARLDKNVYNFEDYGGESRLEGSAKNKNDKR